MSDKICHTNLLTLSETLLRFMWYKNGVSLTCLNYNVNEERNHEQCADTISNAVICKQHIYRVLFKDFFIANYPEFIRTKSKFLSFVFNMCREICANTEYDKFEKFFNTCAFVVELHLFCFSRSLDVNIRASPELLKRTLLNSLGNCMDFSFIDLNSIAHQRYSKLYAAKIKPYMVPGMPYKTILLIDYLHHVLKDSNARKKLKIDVSPPEMPDEIRRLLKELCLALETCEAMISVNKLDASVEVEVSPPIPEFDRAFVNAILCDLPQGLAERQANPPVDQDERPLTRRRKKLNS